MYNPNMGFRIRKLGLIALLLVMLTCLFTVSSVEKTNTNLMVRKLTRNYEFNFFNWTLDAFAKKTIMASLNLPDYLSTNYKESVINDYINNRNRINELKYNIQQIYSNPEITNAETLIASYKSQLVDDENIESSISPLAEHIFSQQIQKVFNDVGFTILGQVFPPLLFEISELPENLIISPKDKIELIYSISLVPKLAIKTIDDLETTIDSDLNLSSLVVPIGGLGSYPTMIESSSSLPWIINTIAHEWTHNWLLFHPLGMNYGKSNELRTMNETTASIIGNEIEVMVLKEYFQKTYSALNDIPAKTSDNLVTEDKDIFNFNDEMRITRVEVESLLNAGQIDDAEAYMESRRKIFWENGYQIRKINQAYFAFYGAYADVPGGAAGNDPVGPAVRKLREQSNSLSEFLLRISKMSNYSDLVNATE
jgi:hypothetical protein